MDDGLSALLRQRIAAKGPLSLADYMAACLGDPRFGYYMTRDPLGRGGDFITAPEISQMFGELLGLWAVDTWHKMGAPAPLHLVELGPGRGTLAKDALRAAAGAPAFAAAAQLHLVETSPPLRAAQAAALGDRPCWHDTLASVPKGPTIILANEFLDALPIHQFEFDGDAWRERRVTWADGRFAWTLTPASAAESAQLNARPGARRAGTVSELAPAAGAIAGAIAGRAKDAATAALFIDYGPAESAHGDSFQAVRNHRPVDPLTMPGAADLTAHVDFAAFAAAATGGGATAHGPISQRAFLTVLGLPTRADRLAAGNPDQAAAVAAAQHRLIDPAEMGILFKVLAITSPGLATPAGFADPASAPAHNQRRPNP